MNAQGLAQLTFELVSIPSLTKHEAQICDWVQAQVPSWLPAGVRKNTTIERHGNTLVVSPPRQRNRPTIGLVGHLDTVTPSPQQTLGIRDGRIYGCGASDMKAGVALMFAMLPHAADTAYNLCWIFYDAEEGDLLDSGLRTLIADQQLPALDLALVLEPTNNQIQAGCMGSLHATVTMIGKRGHSARPWQGDNALTHAGHFLTALSAIPRRDVPCDGLTFTEVISATQMQTHTNRNVIPDAVAININYRFAPGVSVESAVVQCEAHIAAAAGGRAYRCDITDRSPSGTVHASHPLLASWIADQHLRVEPKQAWTDVAQLTAAGIPAVNFGPGDPAQAHQENEYVEIAPLAQGYDLLQALLLG